MAVRGERGEFIARSLKQSDQVDSIPVGT